MSKKQRRPVILSMGGVMPKRPQKKKTDNGALADKNTVNSNTAEVPQKNKKPDRKPNQPRNPKLKFNLTTIFDFTKTKFLYLLIPLMILVLYLFKIDSIPPIGQTETREYQNLSDIQSISYLPVKLVLLTFSKLSVDGELAARLLSVAIAVFSLFCFYKLISTWLDKRTGVISLVLYSASSWLLFQVREDPAGALTLALVPVLLYTGSLLVRSDSILIKMVCALLILQLIFVPGGIWFIVFSVVIAGVLLKEHLDIKRLLIPVLSVIIAMSGYLALMVYANLNNFSQMMKIIGFQSGTLPSLSNIKDNVIALPNQLLFNGLPDGGIWVSGTPIFDYVSAVFLLAGLLYFIQAKIYPVSKILIFFFIALALLSIFINGYMFISLLLPTLYLLIALGIWYLINQWLEIFPNNPLPKLLGISVICLSVLLVCSYHIERYYVAWPRTDEYSQIFKS